MSNSRNHVSFGDSLPPSINSTAFRQRRTPLVPAIAFRRMVGSCMVIPVARASASRCVTALSRGSFAPGPGLRALQWPRQSRVDRSSSSAIRSRWVTMPTGCDYSPTPTRRASHHRPTAHRATRRPPSGDHAFSPGPQPRPRDLSPRRIGVAGKVDVGIDRSIVPSKLTPRDDARATASEPRRLPPCANLLDGVVFGGKENLWLWITRIHDRECYFDGLAATASWAARSPGSMSTARSVHP